MVDTKSAPEAFNYDKFPFKNIYKGLRVYPEPFIF